MNYIEELMMYADRKDLDKADMARLFGVSWQTYHNWIRRKSLPKDYYAAAIDMLAKDGVEPAMMESARLKLSGLSLDGLKAAIQSIDAIYDLENKSR